MMIRPERCAHGIRVAKKPLRRLLVVGDLRFGFDLRRAMVAIEYHMSLYGHNGETEALFLWFVGAVIKWGICVFA